MLTRNRAANEGVKDYANSDYVERFEMADTIQIKNGNFFWCGTSNRLLISILLQMFSSIETEPESESNKSCLLQLSNLCHCMMFLHSGFPELYGPILESIKV